MARSAARPCDGRLFPPPVRGARVPRVKDRPTGPLRWFFRVPPTIHTLLRRVGFAGVMREKMVVLTTRGRRSGAARTTALNYAIDDGTVYVMAGFKKCDWLANLRADPHVEVALGQDRWRGLARVVRDEAERRRGLRALHDAAASQGPPKAVKPLVKAMGLDYDAEVRKLGDGDAYRDLPMIAITRA